MRKIMLLSIFLLSLTAQAANVTLYLFYSTTCSHCHAELLFLDNISTQYPWLDIKKFAVDTSEEDYALMKRFAKAYSVPADYGVPQTYIGDEALVGYWNYNTHGKLIQEMIENCSRTGCADPLAIVQRKESGQAVNTTFIENNLMELPLVGIVNTGSIPLSYVIVAVVVALLFLLLLRAFIKKILKSRRSRS
ncbi:thioredoxin family protein [Candidatus Micrarchaeota archaeon]|nr:thioredoxin family protein [Candidatus Micrarchaeota archaeon]